MGSKLYDSSMNKNSYRHSGRILYKRDGEHGGPGRLRKEHERD